MPTNNRLESLKVYDDLQDTAGARWPEVERDLGRDDLFYLLTRLLRREDLNKDWLFDRIREIEAGRDGYLDLWAREHGKSSCISFGMTIQDILRDPEVTVGIFSHTRPIAKGFLVQIKRELEDNEYLKALFPEILWANPQREAPKWSEDGGLIVKRKGNPKESTVEAWGLVDGQPTGRHFRLRVYDDVVTRESVTTPEQSKKTTDAWELSQNLGVQEDQGGAARYIGTRYHLSDTYSVMLARKAVIPRVYPATHNGRFDGHPVLFSQSEWTKRLRDSSRQTIAAQMLQNPMADSDATFNPLWLKSYEVRPLTLNVYILADPSRGRSAESDNTAIAVIGVSSTGGKFLLDGLCHRMTLSQRWTALRNLYRKWSKANGVQHVAVGYERYGAQSDDEYFQEQMARERYHFPISELNWPRDGTQSKRERVERLEPDFRNGRFYLPLPVFRDGAASTWSVDMEPESKTFGLMQFALYIGATKAQQRAIAADRPELIIRAIKATDQDGKIYDVTCHFFEEFQTFPFGAYKDLVDATSRIYDMDPRPPVLVSRESTEATIYVDGV